MAALLCLFISATIIYVLTTFIYLTGLFRKVPYQSSRKPLVSVVIAVKNESENIGSLISDLASQDYPADKYEILIVDNESDDNTMEIVRQQQVLVPNLKLLTTRDIDSSYRYKKAALDLGIQSASGEIIMTTDGDCHVGSSWISSIVPHFSEAVGMVVGFGHYELNKTYVSKMQSFDFLMLMGAAKGAINHGLYWGCSGNNISFRKSCYFKAGGFDDIQNLTGGDDSLFMQVMRKKTGKKVVFADNKGSWVTTESSMRWRDFLMQRIRWAGDANIMFKYNLVFYVALLASFLSNLAPLVLFPLAFWGFPTQECATLLVLAKFFGEFLVSLKTTETFNQKSMQGFFPIWFVFQIPYVVFMGIMSFGAYKRKW